MSHCTDDAATRDHSDSKENVGSHMPSTPEVTSTARPRGAQSYDRGRLSISSVTPDFDLFDTAAARAPAKYSRRHERSPRPSAHPIKQVCTANAMLLWVWLDLTSSHVMLDGDVGTAHWAASASHLISAHGPLPKGGQCHTLNRRCAVANVLLAQLRVRS